MAFNLTRGAATLTRSRLARARTATIRRTLISVPARIACSARRLTLHLPRGWPWEAAWNTLFNSTSPKSTAHRLTRAPQPAPDTKNQQEQPDTEIGRSHASTHRLNAHTDLSYPTPIRSVNPGLDAAQTSS